MRQLAVRQPDFVTEKDDLPPQATVTTIQDDSHLKLLDSTNEQKQETGEICCK